MAFCLLLGMTACSRQPEPSDTSSGASTTTSSATAETTGSTGESLPTDTTDSTGGSSGTTTRTKTTQKGTTTKQTEKPTTTTKTTTKPTEDESKYNLKKSDFVLDANVWEPPTVTDDFYFEMQAGTPGPFKSLLLSSSIEEYKLGHYDTALPRNGAYEWGNAFAFLDGLVDGAGNKIDSGYDTPPKDRAESVRVIEEFLNRQFVPGPNNIAHPWASMNGHFLWHHYAGEFGFDALGSEIGESINSYQLHVAFNRGAARQYHKPWYIDFSAWHHGYITDYSEAKIWGSASGATNGHSMSLFERAFYMSAMGGVRYYVAEAGASIAFYNELDGNGVYKLSPYGETCQKLNAFATKYPDLGTAYTPFGIVLDYYHGSYPGFGGKLAFNYFKYNAGDNMSWNLMNLFFPGSLEVQGKNEQYTMVNGPYGDTCDFLLQNASQEVLNSYPVLILSGDITLSNEEANRYREYARQGGTLVLNTAYLKFFPEYKKDMGSSKQYELKEGNGTVIVYGGDYEVMELDSIIREQLEKFMPFQVSGDIQYSVSVKNGSLFLTLINNNGVVKEPTKPVVIDKSQSSRVTATYTGSLKILSVTDIKNVRKIPMSGNQVSVNVGAGEVAVLEFRFD